jgi:protein phosphatase
MKIDIPDMALVLLVGSSGSGKSTFAAKHFLPTEIVSSDRARGVVCDDETSMAATADAFDLVHFITRKRLAAGRVTVIDATNVQAFARKPLIDIAKELHCLTVAIAIDLPEDLCHARNKSRPDRNFGRRVVRRHVRDVKQSLRGLGREGMHRVYRLSSVEEVDAAAISRVRLWPDRREERGPFDIIGDVHGCCDELEELLERLGYARSEVATPSETHSYDGVWSHAEGRKAAFVGDIVDRGPRILDAYGLVRNMVEAGSAICVPGNHDSKLVRALRGRKVQVTHGLQDSLAEIDALPGDVQGAVRTQVADFFDSLVSHAVLDDGGLVVAHAGMKESMAGRASGGVRSFALYGDTTGETDEFGAPVRHDWAQEYRGDAVVVYGHTPVVDAEWVNDTINVDTGCVFGGRLTALRYPERELVSVEAREMYAEPIRPLQRSSDSRREAQHASDDTLDIGDMIGRRSIATRLRGNVTVDEERGAAALEVLSRWAVDPKWLIHLPPTMAPPAATERDGLLEHPDKAFAYYARERVSEVILEEKHMGSRAIAIVCREPSVAVTRFGLTEERPGIVYTRTGRAFFPDAESEEAILAAVHDGASAAGLWETLHTDWLCIDCEIMPWSAKARELIEQQYAAVGAAARASLTETLGTLRAAESNGVDVSDIRARYERRLTMAEQFAAAYRHYCWAVESPADLRVAPFHILASEGATHTDRDHGWHMKTAAAMTPAAAGSIVQATENVTVSLHDDDARVSAMDWWEALTGKGGEGAVMKPLSFIARGRRGVAQPALKCRGRAYLRIIYGPEYTEPDYLAQLRQRNVGGKRSLALREFALGVEALERFVRREPLRRVHECVFGVLALESEPLDPRL